MRLTPLATLIPVLLAFAPLPAAAFNCADANDKVSKAICADPAAKTADEEMTRAYDTFRQSLPADRQSFLRSQQRAWLKIRNAICTGWDEKAAVDSACLVKEAKARTAMLQPKPEFAAAGAPAFVAAIDGRIPSGMKLSATLIYPQVKDASTAGLRRFNAAVKTTAEGDREWRTIAAKDVDVGSGSYEYIQQYTLPYASGELISAGISIYSYTGGAHGMSVVRGVNTLTKLDRPLTAKDIIAPEKLADATRFCRAVLGKIKAGNGTDPATDSFLTDDAIVGNMKEDQNWLISKEGASVHYNPYDIGSYAEGAFDCLIPWADLKGFAPASSPLPFS